jgi:hypothetical protein
MSNRLARTDSTARPGRGACPTPVIGRVVGGLAAAASLAAHAEWRVGSGIDCSSGRYGTDDSIPVCIYPNNLHVFQGAWEVKVSVPSIHVNDASDAEGQGDASLFVGYTFARDVLGLFDLELDVKVKGRNGSVREGLGTGRTSQSLGLGAVSLLEGRHLLLLYAGATRNGRPAGGTGAYATAWYKFLHSERSRVGVIYENNDVGHANRIETLTLMPEFVLARRWTIKPFVYRGLRTFGPRQGAGVVFAYTIH